MTIKLLHFSDAHIGVEQGGKRDSQTDLPLRVLDYLKSLDTIIDTAIQNKVDCVLFTGDAYHSRLPSPTLQREWGRRIMRLSKEKIPTILVVGNHDVSPAYQRAHALDNFITLNVPYVVVIDKPQFLSLSESFNLPLQIIAIPWINRSAVMASLDLNCEAKDVYEIALERVSSLIENWVAKADDKTPLIIAAHATVQGVDYGGFSVMTNNNEVVLPPSLLKNTNVDYVGLGHIHKTQNLNEGFYPPIVYAGSIERVDFGEEDEQKGFYLVNVEKNNTKIEWVPLNTRRFVTTYIELTSPTNIMETIWKLLPSVELIKDVYYRLVIKYNRDWEAFIDESALRQYAKEAFDFKIERCPIMDFRVRLPKEQEISSLKPIQILDLYWKAIHLEDKQEREKLSQLAQNIFVEHEQFNSQGI